MKKRIRIIFRAVSCTLKKELFTRKISRYSGVTQLLFGIKGKRWEAPNYSYQHKLYNSWWKRTYPEEMPKNPYCDMETAPYW